MKIPQKREKKKEPGLFGLKKRQNKARRSYMVALLVGGKEWADQLVKEGKICFTTNSQPNQANISE